MHGQTSLPVAAVLAVLVDKRRILLVRRANPPDAGLWGFPGGKIAFGETIMEAAIRELSEETGIAAEPVGTLPSLDVIGHEPGSFAHHFILIPVRCRYLTGDPVAADDALEARWFSLPELSRQGLRTSEGVMEIARTAMALPPP